MIFGRRARQQGRPVERKAMIDRNHELSVKRQAELVGVSRAQVYYLARATSEADQQLMYLFSSVAPEKSVKNVDLARV